MNKWTSHRLGDLLEKKISVDIKKGYEYSFVPMEAVETGFKYPKTVKLKIFNGSGSKFAEGDTLYARITPCLQNKKICTVKNLKNGVGFGSTEFFILRANKKLLDSNFLLYIAKLDDLNKTAELSMVGASGRQRADIKSLFEFEVKIPGLVSQSSIANLLSQYDELIENNEKRIKILEEMAQRLYKNRIAPNKNWKRLLLRELIQDHIGGGWGSESQNETSFIPAFVIRGTDIENIKKGETTNIPFRYHQLSNYNSRKLDSGDIIFEVSGGSPNQPLGRSLIISKELLKTLNASVICASFCKRIRTNKENIFPEILYLSFLDAQKNGEISSYEIRSTGITNFRWTDYINNVYRHIPPIDIQIEFQKIIKPMFSEISLLGNINLKLRNMRDLLIPQIVTGRREVRK